jgi:hypothetical protein
MEFSKSDDLGGMRTMTTWKSTLRILGLALVVLLAQACQRADQTTTENQPAAGGAAAPGNKTASSSAGSANKPAAAAAKPASVTLPAGTAIKVRTTHTLSTKTLQTGDGFDAVLDEPLMAGGKELFPKGAMVMGKVTNSDPGGRVKGVASLAIELNMLHTADGQMVMIDTSPVSVEAKTSKTKDAVKVGAGSAIGAVVGAIAGGGKGAGIGAAAGAGAGTAVVLGTRGDAAEIPSETVLDFSLKSPVTISK